MAEELRSRSSKEVTAGDRSSPLMNLEDGFLSGVTPEVDATSGAVCSSGYNKYWEHYLVMLKGT
jgi:hypothetical protein